MSFMCLAPKAQYSPEAWGNAPGNRRSRRTSALKTQFTVCPESRFQRLDVPTIRSLGRCPRLE